MKNASSDKNISQNKIISILKKFSKQGAERKQNQQCGTALKVFYSYLKTALHLYLQMDASIK